MKTVPPEIIDGIVYLLTALVGWIGKWLQTKNKVDKIKADNRALTEQLMRRRN